jgi:hypothetical protein
LAAELIGKQRRRTAAEMPRGWTLSVGSRYRW